MKPGAQTQRRRGEIHVLRYESGINVVIRFLDLGVVEAGFRESGVLESLDVDHVDEADRRVCPGILLAVPYRKAADVTSADRSQPVWLGLVQIGALFHEHVNADLLRIARRSSRPTRISERPFAAVDALRGPKDVRQGLKRDLLSVDVVRRTSHLQRVQKGQAAVKDGRRKRNRLKVFAWSFSHGVPPSC